MLCLIQVGWSWAMIVCCMEPLVHASVRVCHTVNEWTLACVAWFVRERGCGVFGILRLCVISRFVAHEARTTTVAAIGCRAARFVFC